MNSWRQQHGDARFVLVSQHPDLDREARSVLDIDVEIVGPSPHRWSGPNLQNIRWILALWLAVCARKLGWIPGLTRALASNDMVRAFLDGNMVADLSGDSYRDRPGGFAPAHNLMMLGLHALGTPVCLVSQSLGPFRWFSGRLARHVLDRAAYIYLREGITSRILGGIGVRPDHCGLAPDVAFALPAAHPRRVEGLRARMGIKKRPTGPMVAISMNCLMLDFTANNRSYINQMVALVEHIREQHDRAILLIPHVIHGRELGMDDVEPCRRLAAACGDPPWMFYPEFDCTPMDLKGLIADCEVLVASRMHAGIAGVSSGVPTMMLSWSHKYRGLQREIGIEHLIWESSVGTVPQLLATFDRLWDERLEVRRKQLDYTTVAEVEISRMIDRMALACGVTGRRDARSTVDLLMAEAEVGRRA